MCIRDRRKVRVVQGTAKFVSANELEITAADGAAQLLLSLIHI